MAKQVCIIGGGVIGLTSAYALVRAGMDVTLIEGQALVVPRGTWHRLHVEQPGRLMFVTPSVGSEHRRVEADISGIPA